MRSVRASSPAGWSGKVNSLNKRRTRMRKAELALHSYGDAANPGVGVIMTSQGARIRRSRVGNGGCPVRGDDVDIEVDQPFSGDRSAGGPHTVRGVTCGA